MENPKDELSRALQQMQDNLKKISEEHSERIWLQSGENILNENLRGDKKLDELSKVIVEFFVSYTKSQIGSFYVLEEETLHLHYAYGIKGKAAASFELGEGLIGQAAIEQSLKVLQKIPEKYFKIETSLGKENPDTIAILPIVLNNKTIAVIELAKFSDFSAIQLKLFEEVKESIAVSISTALNQKSLKEAMDKLQFQKGETEKTALELAKQVDCLNNAAIVSIADANGDIIYVNDRFCDISKYPREELMGKNHSILKSGSQPDGLFVGMWKTISLGRVWHGEILNKAKDGSFYWVDTTISPFKGIDGKIEKYVAIRFDITNSKNQKVEIEKTALELNQQVDCLNNAAIVSMADANGDIIYVNDKFCEISKYSREELMGENHRILKSGKQSDGLFAGMWKTISSGKVWHGEILNKAKDGSFYWVDTTITPFKEINGKIKKYVAIRFDITDTKKQSEDLALQAEKLQAQQEELRQVNEALEEQTQNLKHQQEELQKINEELEEQTHALEAKNNEVEAAKYDIEQKTKQLEVSSKYKSEFLANMSHELRTPLNSLLILSKDFTENNTKNLSPDQIESAEIIYKSGSDLLVLINEVLDLSKIEAGKMTINIESISLQKLTDDLLYNFKHYTEKKGLKLTADLEKNLQESIKTDAHRLDQILKNLLSNAIKFTEKGSINIKISKYDANRIIIAVTDTGIGIPADKQMAIFEAFQQADGGTSRKYGGTGLGLSISRELAGLLGAEIKLESSPDKGSTFSLIMPLESKDDHKIVSPTTLMEPVLFSSDSESANKYLNYPAVDDDRIIITADDQVVLIIEDDLNFASILLKQANKKSFKGLSAATGEDGLVLAEKYKPVAIILDLDLPGISGHQVLVQLKENPSLRHIPVHIISAKERSFEAIKEGAIEYLMKPIAKKDIDDAFNRIENFVSRKIKNLLIVEDDENSRKVMRKIIGEGDVACFEAGSAKDAIVMFEKNNIDCIVLDIGLPDMSGFDLIHQLGQMKNYQMPPIIVYTGRKLSRAENDELQKYTESIIIKGIKSEERLLDETALFLHRTISDLPESKQRIITDLYNKGAIFHTKKILLVDDDMRNVFALSKVLRERGMDVIKAENGKTALEKLHTEPDIDLVLMDIMMPEMDGHEAMKRIRAENQFIKLPIIAFTAKAMKDDKQKCMDAGANDYIAKPVDVERLLSLIRVWLSN